MRYPLDEAKSQLPRASVLHFNPARMWACTSLHQLRWHHALIALFLYWFSNSFIPLIYCMNMSTPVYCRNTLLPVDIVNHHWQTVLLPQFNVFLCETGWAERTKRSRFRGGASYYSLMKDFKDGYFFHNGMHWWITTIWFNYFNKKGQTRCHIRCFRIS